MGICNSKETLPVNTAEATHEGLTLIYQGLESNKDQLLTLLQQQQENQTLRQELDRQKLLMEEQLRTYQEGLTALRNGLPQGDTTGELQVNESLEELKKYKSRYFKSTMRTVFSFFTRKHREDLEMHWQLWREFIAKLEEPGDFALELSEENREESEGLTVALQYLEEEANKALTENLLLQVFDLHKKDQDRPTSRSNLLKVLEDLWDHKNEADQADFEALRPYRSMTEFAIEHLTRVYGLKKIAYENICGIIATLKKMHSERDKYGIFLCRMLQLFDPKPISLPLAVYLTKARIEFNRLAAQNVKEMNAIHRPRGYYKPRSSASIVFERKKTASLAETMNFLYALFENDRVSKGIAVRAMKPSNVTQKEFLLFRMCHRVLKMGTTPEKLFGLMDSRQTGTISLVQFVESVRGNMELALPSEDVHALVRLFNVSRIGHVRKDNFINKLNFTQYYEKARNPRYSVTLTEFLSALAEAYKALQTRDLALLRSWFIARATSIATLAQLTDLLLVLDPSIDEEIVAEAYNEGMRLTPAGINCDSFSAIVIKYHIAGYGLGEFRRECVTVSVEKKYFRKAADGSEGGTNKSRNSTPLREKGSAKLEQICPDLFKTHLVSGRSASPSFGKT